MNNLFANLDKNPFFANPSAPAPASKDENLRGLNASFMTAIKQVYERDAAADFSKLFAQYSKHLASFNAPAPAVAANTQSVNAAPMETSPIKPSIPAAKQSASESEHVQSSSEASSHESIMELSSASASETEHGQDKEEEPVQKTFTFGAVTESKPEQETFKFGIATTESKPEQKAFTFGASAATEQKPFTFGSSIATEQKPFTFGATTEQKPFTFGTTTEKNPFTFGSSSANEQTPFTFGASNATEPKTFTFGASNATEPKPFTFGASNATEQKPFTFGTTSTLPAFNLNTTPVTFSVPAATSTNANNSDADDADEIPAEEAESFTLTRTTSELLKTGAGEENETCQHEERCKIYMLNAQKEWTDLGVGIFKINRFKTAEGKSRILCRTEGCGKVTLNTLITAKWTEAMLPEGKKEISLICFNATGGLEKYLVRVKTLEQAKALHSALQTEIIYVQSFKS